MRHRLWVLLGPLGALPFLLDAWPPAAGAGAVSEAQEHSHAASRVSAVPSARAVEGEPAEGEAAEAGPRQADVGSEPSAGAPSEPTRTSARIEPDAPLPQLVALGRFAHVYEKPSVEARRLGYLRAGAVVRRSAEATAGQGC